MRDSAIFTPRRGRSLVRELTDHVRRRIVSGELRPGTQLPSMRKLAKMYGVSLPTMQAALHGLAAVGFVRITHGVGTFVSRPRSSATVLIHACVEATPFELAAIRATIDERMPVLAARAARRAKGGVLPPQLRDLPFLAAERSLSRHNAPAEAFLRADAEFHRAIIASVEGLAVSAGLSDQIRRRLIPTLMAAAARQAGDVGLDRAHLTLATAIIDGDVPMAARLARAIAKREAETLEPLRARLG